jgi:formiminoglutamate deiminase
MNMSRHIRQEVPMSALWFETALVGENWANRVRLEISDGLISAIATGVDPAPGDERHKIGLPGLPNLHSHAFQRGMAGLAEQRGTTGDDFWSWRDLMYRFLDRLGPEDVEAIAALAYVEMLEAGFTRVGEFHYLHHDVDGRPYADPAEMAARIAAAAEASGIALTLLPVFYAHGGFGGAAPGAAQRRFLSDPDRFARLVEGARAVVGPDAAVGIAPHSLRAATPEEIEVILPLAAGGPVHIHIAEQFKEVSACLAWSGLRPVEWLFDEMPVDDRWCLVHATHVTDAERSAIARSGAVAGLCPITEANLGDGIFPATAYLAEDGAFGVGSDSNVLISATEELRLLEYGQRLSRHERCVLAGERASIGATLFNGALAGGSRALGVEGGIAIGRPADLVSLDANDPAFVARWGDRLLDSWIFAARDGIDCVWRRGVRQVEGGRHVRGEEIRRRYATVLARLIG